MEPDQDVLLMEEKDTGETKAPTTMRLKEIQLPDGIHRSVIRQYFTALAVAVITIWLCFYEGNPTCITGFSISGALIYFGVSTKLDYAAGLIQERAVICASVSCNIARNNTRVVFRTQEEIPSYYEFMIPGKHRNVFLPNYAYIVYFRESAPKTLLGYTQI